MCLARAFRRWNNSQTGDRNSHLRGLTGLLHRRAEPALGPGGGIAMDDIASGCLIEFFACQSEFALGLLVISGSDGSADTTNGATHVAADAPVSETADFALAESFFGALGIWHVFGSDIRVLPRWRLQELLISRRSIRPRWNWQAAYYAHRTGGCPDPSKTSIIGPHGTSDRTFRCDRLSGNPTLGNHPT